MNTSFIIYHVELGQEGLVKALPNARPGDLVFITGRTEGAPGRLGVLCECTDHSEHLWTTQPVPAKDFPAELMSRLQHRLSGDEAPDLFEAILGAGPAGHAEA